MVRIPYGTSYTATYTGSAMKSCTCESCSQEYVYSVERSASGQGTSVLWLDNQGAQGRAARQAEDALRKELDKAVDPVACPACGWFQANMVSILKRQKTTWPLGISLTIALVLFLWGVFTRNSVPNHSWELIIAAVAVAAVGAAIAIAMYVSHDPNADHGGPEASHRASTSKGTLKSEFEAQQAAEHEALQRNFREGIQQAMLLMVAAGGQVKRERAEAAARLYQQITEVELGVDKVCSLAQNADVGRDETFGLLHQLGDQLSDEGKGLFVQTAIIVAAADDGVDEQEWDILGTVAGALQMSGAEVNAILDDMQRG